MGFIFRFPGSRGPCPGKCSASDASTCSVLSAGSRELKWLRFSITQHTSSTAESNTPRWEPKPADAAHQDVDTTTANRPLVPVTFNRVQSLSLASSRGYGHFSVDRHFGWQLPHQVIHSSLNFWTLVIEGGRSRRRPQRMTSSGRCCKESLPVRWVGVRSLDGRGQKSEMVTHPRTILILKRQIVLDHFHPA